jgi:hypothetical protein
MNISLLPPDLSQLRNLVFLDLSNNPISDYHKVGKSLSTINNLQQLRIDLTTVDNVEIILRNLPNLKMLNDKPIQANLFSQENESENPTQNNNLSDNINNINNNEVISDENNNEQKDLPDSSIENEIANYDVRIYMYLTFNI